MRHTLTPVALLHARFLELKQSRRLPKEMTFEQYFWCGGQGAEARTSST